LGLLSLVGVVGGRHPLSLFERDGALPFAHAPPLLIPFPLLSALLPAYSPFRDSPSLRTSAVRKMKVV